jgi:hypothetical protein
MDPEDTAAEIAHLREQVEALMRERVTPAIAGAAESAATAVHDAAGVVQEHAEAVAGKVREQPLLAILLAAAIGYVFGRTTR